MERNKIVRLVYHALENVIYYIDEQQKDSHEQIVFNQRCVILNVRFLEFLAREPRTPSVSIQSGSWLSYDLNEELHERKHSIDVFPFKRPRW